MNEELKEFLEKGYTPFQSAALCERILKADGFIKVCAHALPKLESGGKYYLSESGTLAAFTVNSPDGFMIATSHTDSPVLKVKGGKPLEGHPARLNCEAYGGAVNYSFFDIPLKICGRIYCGKGGRISPVDVVSPYCVNIPSLAVHHNREVNNGFAPSRQFDLAPILGGGAESFTEALAGREDVLDFDLYACPAVTPFESGINGEFLCSPRIDNLISVFAAIKALTAARPKGINMCVCFHDEETGSGTRLGAGAVFLPRLLEDVYRAAGGKNYGGALNDSFIMSVDNAHALHPAHPEKSDPVNRAYMNGGIVLKRHINYSTDALTASAARQFFLSAAVPVQEYYNHSDLPCGSTLGLIAAARLGIRACDIGIAQLAMHSAIETCGSHDPEYLIKGLTSFFSSGIKFNGDGAQIL